MKKILPLLFATQVMFALRVHAQNYDNPGVYMQAIAKAQADMNKKYMAYTSAAWHSNRAGKVDKLRQQLIDAITACRYKIIDLPIYKGDNSLRKSNIDYLWLLNKVFYEDYSHLVNMESLIDQSVDQMELYLNLQDKITDTLKAANDRIGQAEKEFAIKYNVTLVDNKTEAAQKMEVAGKVRKYHHKVYILFFKCAWEESQVFDAIGKKNITKVEQARSALIKYATDGVTGLDSLATYDGDPALATACKTALDFFKKEAETDLPKISDYLLKEEEFNKIKTAYDSKPANSRTQQDKDNYNKAVTDLGAALAVANQAAKTIFADRNKMVINWNNVDDKFSSNHMPYYR